MNQKLLQIHFERKAERFFDKKKNNKEEVTALIIKAIRKLSGYNENIDIKRLSGKWKGYLRIRKGVLRVVIRVIEEENLIIVKVIDVDFRGSIYK